jgi:hypothetical protein
LALDIGAVIGESSRWCGPARESFLEVARELAGGENKIADDEGSLKLASGRGADELMTLCRPLRGT